MSRSHRAGHLNQPGGGVVARILKVLKAIRVGLGGSIAWWIRCENGGLGYADVQDQETKNQFFAACGDNPEETPAVVRL